MSPAIEITRRSFITQNVQFMYTGNGSVSGIYKLTNVSNGRVYFGSAGKVIDRWKNHALMLVKNSHYNAFLQADYNKTGPLCFVFEVVECVSGDRLARTTVEQRYIDDHYDGGKNCYNLRARTIQTQGPWSYTPEESFLKRSAAQIGNKNSLGSHKTEEAKQKIALARKGKPSNNKRLASSEETKRRQSESMINSPHRRVGEHLPEETKLKKMKDVKLAMAAAKRNAAMDFKSIEKPVEELVEVQIASA